MHLNVKVRRCRGSSEMNSRSATTADRRGCDVSEVPCRSPEHHETCAQSKKDVLGSNTSHLSHDDHRARQRHKHSQPRRARADSLMTTPSCLGGSSHGWVPVNTHSTSVPTSVGRLRVAQQHYPHHNLFNTITSNLFSLTDWTLHGEPSHLAYTPLHAQPMCLPLTLRRVGF